MSLVSTSVAQNAPDASWLKANLKLYMDAHGIAYNSNDTKTDLLNKINAT